MAFVSFCERQSLRKISFSTERSSPSINGAGAYSFGTERSVPVKFRPTFWTHIVGGDGHIVQLARETRDLLLSSISLLETDSRGATDWSQDEADSSGQL